jgi:hypothetical protein
MLGGASGYTSCPDCGTSVGLDVLETDRHRCDARHRDEHVLRLVLAEVDLFEADLRTWLETPQGRFAAYYARTRRT